MFNTEWSINVIVHNFKLEFLLSSKLNSDVIILKYFSYYNINLNQTIVVQNNV